MRGILNGISVYNRVCPPKALKWVGHTFTIEYMLKGLEMSLRSSEGYIQGNLCKEVFDV